MNYYNEFDPRMAAWLRELIARKLIPDGFVDERSITEIHAPDLQGFTQCHFFAGIGFWPLAFQLAGWPADRPVWTGSCPCQPFSAAGKGDGNEDERHLWPTFFNLIEACRPPVVFGEQVASALVVGKAGGGHREEDGPVWLDGVFSDLESADYSTGACVLGAHSVLAPHIRQRLYWVADSDGRDACSEREQRGGEQRLQQEGDRGCRLGDPTGGGLGVVGDAARAGSSGHPDGAGSSPCGLGDPQQQGLEGHARNGNHGDQPGRVGTHPAGPVAPAGAVGGVGDTPQSARERNTRGLSGAEAEVDGQRVSFDGGLPLGSEHAGSGVDDARWSESYWHLCRDGKHRRVPVEPTLFPLADGGRYVVPGMARRRTVRPALLHGAGNAIVPQVAAEFIQAYLETLTP